MNIYRILCNEISTKKMIYTVIVVSHLVMIGVLALLNMQFIFILPSLLISSIFCVAFYIQGNQATQNKIRFLFYFNDEYNQQKECISNAKYMLLISILINSIMIFTSFVISNLYNLEGHYLLLVLLGLLMTYGLFEYYRFTITEINVLYKINKTCNNKDIKINVMNRLDIQCNDIENVLFNVKSSYADDYEIYSLCTKGLIISMEKGFVFTPNKIPLKAFRVFVKENELLIDKLTHEDFIILEMFSC